jgi:hypothetical protein
MQELSSEAAAQLPVDEVLHALKAHADEGVKRVCVCVCVCVCVLIHPCVRAPSMHCDCYYCLWVVESY